MAHSSLRMSARLTYVHRGGTVISVTICRYITIHGFPPSHSSRDGKSILSAQLAHTLRSSRLSCSRQSRQFWCMLLSSFTGRRAIVLKVSLLLSVIKRSLLRNIHVCLSVCTEGSYPLKRIVCSLTGVSCSFVCTEGSYPLKRIVCSLTGVSCSCRFLSPVVARAALHRLPVNSVNNHVIGVATWAYRGRPCTHGLGVCLHCISPHLQVGELLY